MVGGEGSLRRLSPEEAEETQHEFAGHPDARFFRVEMPLPGAGSRSPLQRGDVLIALVGSPPRTGDPVVVEVAGQGYRLGQSGPDGAGCRMASGETLPLTGEGEGGRLAGVVVGLLRRARPGAPG
jgi:hypothetical protein